MELNARSSSLHQEPSLIPAAVEDPRPQSPEDLSDASLQRYVMRLGMDFFLRTATSFSELFDGNLMTGLVFVAICQSSVQHLNHPLKKNPLAEEGVFPDDLRRPVSVLGLAQFLGVPYETTRRHVKQLLDKGYVVKADAKGVIVPAEVIRRPEINRLVAANYVHVRQMIAALHRGASEVTTP